MSAPTADRSVMEYVHSLRLRRERTYARGAWSGLAPYQLDQLRLELGISEARARSIDRELRERLAQVTTPDPVGTPYPWCVYPAECSASGSCERPKITGYSTCGD